MCEWILPSVADSVQAGDNQVALFIVSGEEPGVNFFGAFIECVLDHHQRFRSSVVRKFCSAFTDYEKGRLARSVCLNTAEQINKPV